MRRAGIAVLGSCLLGSCTSGPTGPKDMSWMDELDPGHIDSSYSFPGANMILEGFDLPLDGSGTSSGSPLLTGDQILYGVSIERPGDLETWLVHMEIMDADDGDLTIQKSTRTGTDGEEVVSYDVSKTALLRISLYDGDGKALGENDAKVAEQFLRRGLYRSSRETHAWRRLPEEERQSALDTNLENVMKEDLLAFGAFFGLIHGSELLFPILREAMPMPSWFGMLANFGVNVTANLNSENAVAYLKSGSTPWGAEVYRVPVIFDINDDPSLLCSLLVVPSRSPLHVGAGIVSVVGKRPGNDPMRCRLQLLAARRGG